jgi:hypothetical protein
MSELSSSPRELDRVMAKAQALFEAGKQGSALGQLWRAEALARGYVDDLRALLAVAEGYEGRLKRKRHEADLARLVKILRVDLAGARGVASSVPVAAAGVGSDAHTGWLLIALVVFILGIVALAVLAWIESVMAGIP